MTDINSSKLYSGGAHQGSSSKSGANPLFLREDELRQGIEMLFFAYRDFISEPDGILAQHDLGRAHHRVIYFVGRYPGMSVSELLSILQITKQSLSRVLGQLVSEGYIVQKKGNQDRRQRLLTLTDKGSLLERQLTANQRDRMERAFQAAGGEAVEGFRKVMTGIMSSPGDRARFERQGKKTR